MFAVLFIISRGGFKSSAAYLRRHSRTLRVLVPAETLAMALMILFAADLCAILYTKKTEDQDTIKKGYLYREDYGGNAVSQTVSLKKGGKEEEVQIELKPRELTQKEINKALDSAVKALPDAVLGKQTADRVTEDVTLPDSFGSPAVSLEWITGDPEVIDWDGTLGEDLPSEGAEVTLTCELSLEDTVRETELKLNVFPKKQTEKEKLEQTVQEEIGSANSGTEKKVKLPDEISGEKVQWSSENQRNGIRILALGLLLSGAVVILKRKEHENQKEQRKKELETDYPKIIGRFVLFMNAGLSVRKSLEKIEESYRKKTMENSQRYHMSQMPFLRKKESHPGFEEICRTMEDMRRGMTEIGAYEQLGRRCEAAEYKTFADLLIRCVTKGGRDILVLMQKEAKEAEELRKRQVRIRGEEAGTKILIPMVLMLAIVMAILMVPAMMTFTY